MWTIGPFGFGAPFALFALVGLPLIWLVVRALPPRPSLLTFPPIDILRRIPKTEDTPAKAPPWLAIFRAFALILFLVGLSAPLLNPPKIADNRPLLVIIDDGWTAAPIWQQVQEEARRATLSNPPQVRIIFTAPQKTSTTSEDAMTPQRAAARLADAQPQPILADHIGTAARIARLPRGQRVIWFSDNVSRPGSAELASALAKIGSLKVRVIGSPVVSISRAEATSSGYSVATLGAVNAKSNAILAGVDARGRVVAENTIQLDSSSSTLPVEIALVREIAAIRIQDARSAGGVFLLDAFDRRTRVGLIAQRQDDQPLLSDAHYLQEALTPFAEISRGDIESLASSGLDVILLPDTGELPAREEAALATFIEKGGILVRFAGPKIIASGNNQLVPAPLADQARALRGSLAWDNASSIGLFDRAGPFAGLAIPADAKVSQVATFAPSPQSSILPAAPQIWARLSDGTPLVSAAARGRGWTVLFHTTAGPAWSDVAFSGLQVSMLRRVLARAGSNAIPAKAVAPTAPLKPILVLDGFGNFRAPAAGDSAVELANVASARADSRHPPGIYEGGGSRLILQASGPETLLPALPNFAGVERIKDGQQGPRAFGPFLLGLGLLLLILDMLLVRLLAIGVEWQSIGLAWPRKIAKTALVLAVLSVLTPLDIASAQSSSRPRVITSAQSVAARATKTSPADLSLAYIKTGDAPTDARARAGLEGLSRVLAARTSVEPGAVIGVDPATQDLALFPLLYWLLPDQAVETPAASARALDRYMKSGGVLFVDTRGAGRDPNAARNIARAALRGIEAPPLEPVPPDHVLGKSFYILRGFPGRFQNAQLWVETVASASASANDGVSPLIVGNGDWASAWANAQPNLNFGGMSTMASNTEVAARVGVNIVLYALTGNYKADQVHFETLLKRLTPRTQNGAPR